MKLRVGIVKSGEPSVDYSWTSKMDDVNFAVLRVRNLTDEFVRAVLPHKHKLLLCVVCSGYGDTVVEPNIMDIQQQAFQLKRLVSMGFPKERVCLCVEPIIPTVKGIKNFVKVVEEMHAFVSCCSVDILKNTPLIQKRFAENKLPVLYGGEMYPSQAVWDKVDGVIAELSQRYNLLFLCDKDNQFYCATRCEDVAMRLVCSLSPDAHYIEKVAVLNSTPYGYCKKFQLDDSFGGSCGLHKGCSTCSEHNVYGCMHSCIFCGENA